MTTKPKAKKLSKTQAKIIERLIAGDLIIKSYDEKGETTYSLLQAGTTVGAPTFYSLHSTGAIAPRGDGLFNDSQCFGLAEAA